ncbi:MAG: amidoligase family protein, partial [Polyangiaceae bacterium]
IDTALIERLEARPPRTVAEVNAAWYGRQVHSPARYDQSRYHGVNLNSYFFRGTIEFRYFEGTTHAGKVKAYVQFCLALAAKALGAKSASSRRREYNPATAKYDFRVFLLSLGLIGEEFKTARLHLLSRLGGSAAWKGERRDRRTPPASPEERPAAVA